MTKRQNQGAWILGLLLAFGLWQQNLSITQQSIMDNIPFLIGATGLEKQVIFWVLVVVVGVIVVQSFFHGKK